MKRSTQVALVLMGAAGIGASAYAFTSKKNDCVPAAKPAAATPVGVTDKDTKDEPCSPRRSNTGYYRSYWRSSSPSYWWLPIFNRNPQPTTTTTTTPSNSPTSLGLTSRPSTTSTTARPSTSTAPARTGFGTTGTSIAHSTAS